MAPPDEDNWAANLAVGFVIVLAATVFVAVALLGGLIKLCIAAWNAGVEWLVSELTTDTSGELDREYLATKRAMNDAAGKSYRNTIL